MTEELGDLVEDRDAVLGLALRKARGMGHPEVLAETAFYTATVLMEAITMIAAELRSVRGAIEALRPVAEASLAPEPQRPPSPLGADLVAAILAIVTDAPGACVEVTSAELLARLEVAAPEAVRGSMLWPTSPRSLSVLLRHLGPELRTAGLEAGQGRGVARRVWSIRRRPAASDGGAGVAEHVDEGSEAGE